MNRNLTIGERLKDLRVALGLNLEELAAQTGLSKSALSSYETEDEKDINHRSIVLLAMFYGVSADYLLGLTETKNHPNAALSELHLSDDMIKALKSGAFNPRLLCELATHPDFAKFLTNAEIYVDGLATMQIQNLNTYIDIVQAQIIEQYRPGATELYLQTLDAARISENDYFCNMADNALNAILCDLREQHRNDSGSGMEANLASELKQDLEEAASLQGSPQEKQVMMLCRKLGIDYENLPPDEFRIFIKTLRRSKLLTSPIKQRGKQRKSK